MTGVIVACHKRQSGAMTYTIATKSGVTAYVPVLQRDKDAEAFPKKAHVRVVGHVEGTVRKDDNGKAYVSQYFIADKIQKEQNLIAEYFGADAYDLGHFYKESDFKYYVGGRVVRIARQGDFLHLSVETETDDKDPVIVKLQARTVDAFPQIEKCDNIICQCGVYTKNRGYRNLTVTDLDVAGHSKKKTA